MKQRNKNDKKEEFFYIKQNDLDFSHYRTNKSDMNADLHHEGRGHRNNLRIPGSWAATAGISGNASISSNTATIVDVRSATILAGVRKQ
jgi:hypothetical protein